MILPQAGEAGSLGIVESSLEGAVSQKRGTVPHTPLFVLPWGTVWETRAILIIFSHFKVSVYS